jgi:hypothetical protein
MPDPVTASERACGVDHDDAMIALVLVYSALVFNLGSPDANVK